LKFWFIMVDDAGVPVAVSATLVLLQMVLTVGVSTGANGGLFTYMVFTAAQPPAV
jgi:hypothetical protein